MDTVAPSTRSEIMRAVHSRDTTPELAVRALVRQLGFRCSLHSKRLPGTPDLVFLKMKKVIFVHGCFWHRHQCEAAKLPSSNIEYWQRKQANNTARDRQNIRALRVLGWKSLIVWECQLRNMERLCRRVSKFLCSE